MKKMMIIGLLFVACMGHAQDSYMISGLRYKDNGIDNGWSSAKGFMRVSDDYVTLIADNLNFSYMITSEGDDFSGYDEAAEKSYTASPWYAVDEDGHSCIITLRKLSDGTVQVFVFYNEDNYIIFQIKS